MSLNYKITREEILKGQDCPPALEPSLAKLLFALNTFRANYSYPMIVTSGYRSPEHNEAIRGAPESAHCLCMAADFSDPSPHPIRQFATEEILEASGLYMEAAVGDSDPHVHLQIRPTLNRIFQP